MSFLDSAAINSPLASIVRQEGEEAHGEGLLGTPYHQPTLAPEGLFHLGPITVTNSMLMTVIAVVLLSLLVFWMSRGLGMIPGRKQNFLEAVIEALLGLVEGTAGRRVGRVIFPLIATLFIYILFANWFSLLPGVGTILWNDPIHAENAAEAVESVPLLRAPNADLNMTLAMAVITLITVQVAGFVAHGFGGHLKEYRNPLNIVDEVARLLSLSIRLFANVFGGEVLLTVMLALSFLALSVFVGLAVVSVFVPVVFLGLELFIGVIQALVFSLLALIYITLAVGGHGEHADAETAEAQAEAASH